MELVAGGTAVAAAAGAIYHFCLRDRSKEYEEQALTVLFRKVVGEQEKADPNEMRTQIKQKRYEEDDLSLSYGRLRCFPVEACSFKHIKLLAAHHNRLSSLPPEIGQLTSLTYINLKNNNLATLPSEFGQLRALEIVVLSGNWMTSLPATMKDLVKLRRMSLADNRLSNLAIDFSKLLELRQLDITANPIERVDATICTLIRLAANRDVNGLGLTVNDRNHMPFDFRYLEEVLSSRRQELKMAAYLSSCEFGAESGEYKASNSLFEAFNDAVEAGRFPNCIQNPYLQSKLKKGWSFSNWFGGS